MNGSLAMIASLASLFVAACGISERLPPVPLSKAQSYSPLDIPNARFYADGDPAPMHDLLRLVVARSSAHAGARPPGTAVGAYHYLAISGGGDDGAFGAGLLYGWGQRGDRPEFGMVTGTSTGALTAPFIFLGRDYDEQLRAIYTEIDAADVFTARPPLLGLTGDAMSDTAPLRSLIAKHLDMRMISKIAAEYGRGRLLLIATTNLDQSRAIIWNIGAIAESRSPKARDLIVDVLSASAAIPGAFPPVMIDVTVNGERFQEMHVDGGAMAQAFLYPPSMDFKKNVQRKGPRQRQIAYIIRNGRLARAEARVPRQALAVATQAMSTMAASSGVNDMYRIYLTAKRDDVDFNLAYIGEDFSVPYTGPFDRGYMRQLFEHGRRRASAGYPWQKKPPGYHD